MRECFAIASFRESFGDICGGIDDRQLYLYGDLAYPNRLFIIAPFQGSELTPEEQAFNDMMASVRMYVL